MFLTIVSDNHCLTPDVSEVGTDLPSGVRHWSDNICTSSRHIKTKLVLIKTQI